jgi:hypothetical protein
MSEEPQPAEEQDGLPDNATELNSCGETLPCDVNAEPWRRVNLALWWAFSGKEREG